MPEVLVFGCDKVVSQLFFHDYAKIYDRCFITFGLFVSTATCFSAYALRAFCAFVVVVANMGLQLE